MPRPLHTSPESHGPIAGRHGVPGSAKTSPGQLFAKPSHDSAASHRPATPRHSEPFGFTPSGGQLGETPLQFSAASHRSVAARQPVVAGSTTSGGQSGETPLQASATSQLPATGRHGVVFGSTMSVGQVVDTPSQVSATSQAPATGRHGAPPLPAEWMQRPVALQRSVVQAWPSSGHGPPAGSYWQVSEQQSPDTKLPSSHCSPGSSVLSPQPRGTVSRAVSATGRLNAHGAAMLKLPPAVMS